MSHVPYYPKPCMTNLPPEIYRKVVNEIMNSPLPDYNQLQQESIRINEETKRKIEKYQKEHACP